jgi:hypothetical protein
LLEKSQNDDRIVICSAEWQDVRSRAAAALRAFSSDPSMGQPDASAPRLS